MKYQSVVVLTGAGVSAESGIKTFRASDGLWENQPVKEVATPEGFARNPSRVQNFYNQRRQQLAEVEPNRAHLALAEFEWSFNGGFLLITQNVDDLHERAGSRNLIHMHGELKKARCLDCDYVSVQEGDLGINSLCPNCHSVGLLRPHIVWFGEMPLEMEFIEEQLANCDLFIAIGTSGNVYPAAGFFYEAQRAGAHTVELNLDPGENASLFDEQICGPATTIVADYLKTL